MAHRRLVSSLLAASLVGAYGSADHGAEASEVVCNSEPLEDYNMHLAIVSVFVILIISFLGAAFPALLALKRHPYLVLSIKLGSFAGSGVLLATGFVHMLLSAEENLSNPCLSEAWRARYPAWGFLFAVCTIVALQVLDYLLAVTLEPNPLEGPSFRVIDGAIDLPVTEDVVDIESSSTSVGSGTESEPNECNKHSRCKDKECNGRTLLPAPEVSTKTRALSGLIMSEVSICSHSIIIGLTLGVTQSSQFTALFIAIIFHQLLEGVALGSNASEAGLSTRSILLLAATYSITTPIGIAIGIGVRHSLNTNSSPMLMVTGILDAISAGTLIFLALGDHMNALKSQAGWLRAQRIPVQLSCFAAFFTGAAVLLVLALWA